ncbi:MAG: hypothetical protein V4653_07690 [Pseudomonadota bacterium]
MLQQLVGPREAALATFGIFLPTFIFLTFLCAAEGGLRRRFREGVFGLRVVAGYFGGMAAFAAPFAIFPHPATLVVGGIAAFFIFRWALPAR